jgi:hypothetical protein
VQASQKRQDPDGLNKIKEAASTKLRNVLHNRQKVDDDNGTVQSSLLLY